MGLKSWVHAKLGTEDILIEHAQRLWKWEDNQTNDGALNEADPLWPEVSTASDLLHNNPEEAFPLLLELAGKGSVWSMILVAWCYGGGSGVDKSYEEAEHWYRSAYEAGSDLALLRYADYLNWRGDHDTLQTVYEAGWARGFVPAVYRLIRMRLKPTLTLEDRLSWKPSLEWAAAAGHPGARHLLAKYLFRGWFGLRGVPLGLKLLGGNLKAILRGDENRPIGP